MLWDYSEDQLATQIQSISRLPQVVNIELENLDNSKIVSFQNPKSETSLKNNIIKIYDLKYKDVVNPIGRLKIEYNRQHIFQKLYDKALFIILSQFLKSLIITSILLYLFNVMVSRRLIEITGFIHELKNSNFKKIPTEKYFKNPIFNSPKYSDEVSQISKALVLMAYKTRRLHRLTQNEIEYTRQELENQKEVSVQVGKMATIGEMASGIVHEINNPLAVVQSRTEILKRDRESLAEDQRPGFDKSIDVLEKMISRMAVITKSILTMSRDDATEDFKSVDLQDILQDVLILVENKAKKKDVRLEISSSHFVIQCRQVQISQIITNLMNNSIDALEASEERWVKVVTETEIKNNEEFLVIKVIDSGHGIPEAIRDKLMQPFFTTKSKGKGIGIGLSISKGIAVEHKGSLSLNSQSANTCFELRLPINTSVQQSLAA